MSNQVNVPDHHQQQQRRRRVHFPSASVVTQVWLLNTSDAADTNATPPPLLYSSATSASASSSLEDSNIFSNDCCQQLLLLQHQQQLLQQQQQQWYLESELNDIKNESRRACAKWLHAAAANTANTRNRTTGAVAVDLTKETTNGDVGNDNDEQNQTVEEEITQSAAATSTAITMVATAPQCDEKNDALNEEDGKEDVLCVRGLEARMCRERQLNRLLTIRAIVAAQARYPMQHHQPCGGSKTGAAASQGEWLANIARRCTAWASDIARNAAISDYMQVYQQQPQDDDDNNNNTTQQQQAQQLLQQPPLSTVAPCPIAYLRKRLQTKNDNGGVVGRRVRARHDPVVAR